MQLHTFIPLLLIIVTTEVEWYSLSLIPILLLSSVNFNFIINSSLVSSTISSCAETKKCASVWLGPNIISKLPLTKSMTVKFTI